MKLTKTAFRKFTQTLLKVYPYFSNEELLIRALEKVEHESFQGFVKSADFQRLLFKLNTHVSMQEVTQKLCELQEQTTLMQLACKGLSTKESLEEAQSCFEYINNKKQESLNELFSMLEGKKLM